MPAALAPVAPRLGKLIPRLATDHDGEVLATVAAIRRTLEGQGLTLHDLAAVIEAPPHTAPRGDDPPPSDDVSAWRLLASEILESGARLNEKERHFVGQMARTRRPLSAKQADWLYALWERSLA